MYDDEIDFYYLRNRYYNANRGRFINADSGFFRANLFEYCGNNSVAFYDIDGFSERPVDYNQGAGIPVNAAVLATALTFGFVITGGSSHVQDKTSVIDVVTSATIIDVNSHKIRNYSVYYLEGNNTKPLQEA